MTAAGTTGAGPAEADVAGAAARAPAAVNGVALHAANEQPTESVLRERAWGELLRQEAVRRALLAPAPHARAPELTEADRETIGHMLDAAVPPSVPTAEECRRWYDAHASQFVAGALVHARHILFAVTSRVDVHRLVLRAEQALLELSRKDVPAGRFGELARELSNCPSGVDGGDLGWFGPHECADELANELFHQNNPLRGIGLRPRLVHSRFGFHVIEVLGRRQGRQLPFAQVSERVALELAQQARSRALHQYLQVLAGAAQVTGVTLAGSQSPLVQ